MDNNDKQYGDSILSEMRTGFMDFLCTQYAYAKISYA